MIVFCGIFLTGGEVSQFLKQLVSTAILPIFDGLIQLMETRDFNLFDKFDRYATINFRRIKIVDNLKINQRRREITII